MYSLLRTILFFFDPEKVHYFSMNMLRRATGIGWLRRLLASRFRPVGVQPVQVLGLQFPHRIGLAAGFDKNAAYLAELQMLGFGHVEIGTVTPRAQDGNEKPRLFRLPEDKALINRMGFNNEGADAVAARLQAWRRQHPATTDGRTMIIGGNIGKNKTTPNEQAYLDYDICFRKLAPYVDYFVVNVSSPNTPGLRELQEKESLRQILTHLQGLRTETGHHLPILLKIAPDLTNEQLDDIASLATEIQLDGLVATNTTVARQPLSDAGKIRAGEAGTGGLSGAPVREKSTAVQRYLHQRLQGRIPIIASGGVFTAADVAEKLDAGASLVQVWTGFVYQGPAIVKRIAAAKR
ncbi:MAG: quinone-dependent dihydroorotate dehydrogenase [Chitinophagaceae bacterium]|nr:quinone-dependent dihydroorotate dehydrogenase [Chitinophagaceae bacterium]